MSWYLRKQESGAVYGPAERTALREWAVQGRVAPEDFVSEDGKNWIPAPELHDLEMEWMIEIEPQVHYGPLNLEALKDLAIGESLSPDTRLTNTRTLDVRTLAQALAGETPKKAAPAGPALKPSEPDRAGAPQPAATSAPPKSSADPKAEWKAIASSKDFYERESSKWKKMYEDEHENGLRRENALNERIETLRKSELAARMQLEQVERKLGQAEEKYRILKQTVEAGGAQSSSGVTVEIVEAYNELSERYESLAEQIAAKSTEVKALVESRAQAEKGAEEQIKRTEEIVRREREEADNARKRMSDMEEDHQQLVRAYRELNARFIRLRQQPKSAPAASTAPGEPPPPSQPDGKSRIRLKR